MHAYPHPRGRREFGTSTHMSGVREVFSEITQRDIDVEVELGDDRVVRAVERGTVAFQRESRPDRKSVV